MPACSGSGIDRRRKPARLPVCRHQGGGLFAATRRVRLASGGFRNADCPLQGHVRLDARLARDGRFERLAGTIKSPGHARLVFACQCTLRRAIRGGGRARSGDVHICLDVRLGTIGKPAEAIKTGLGKRVDGRNAENSRGKEVGANYCSAAPIFELLSPQSDSRLSARPPTPPIIASAISDAIRPYSIAVAPDLSAKNLKNTVNPRGLNGYTLRLTAKS